MVLFVPLINERKGKKLIKKANKYKLYSCSKMQFAFFTPRHSKKFLENHRFCWKSGNDADSRGREVCSLRPYDTVRTIIRKISMWLTSNVTTIWKPVYWFLQEMKWIVSIRWNKSSKMPKNVHNLTNLVNSLYSATITHCTKKLSFRTLLCSLSFS